MEMTLFSGPDLAGWEQGWYDALWQVRPQGDEMSNPKASHSYEVRPAPGAQGDLLAGIAGACPECTEVAFYPM